MSQDLGVLRLWLAMAGTYADWGEASMRFRPASIDDAPFISRLVVAAWRDAYGGFLPASLLASLAENPHHDRGSWEGRIGEPAAVTSILSDELGKDVGVLRVTDASSIPRTDGELTTLYLLPQARGRGLGSEAVTFARAEASRRGRRRLGFCVLEGNERGQRFYERLGARPIGERIAFRWEDRPILELLYRFY
ncbi:Ribosomal protein S18 acetylase RimI [Rhizobiales bacterium GAS191]|nr:Ribosomal protein S18 acetylase RimI [Rhizobiales bacterium GAS191]